MIIKVLGTGCPNCQRTTENVKTAVAELGIKAEVQKVEDIMKIMEYDIMSTPAIVVDEKVKIKGRVATVSEIKEVLQN